MLKTFTHKNLNLFDLSIITLPLSIIFGNLVLNLNIFIAIITGVYFLRKNLIFFFKKYFLYVILFSLFLCINIYFSENLNLSLRGAVGIYKNIFLAIIIFYWLNKNEQNIKNLLIIIFVSQILVIISILINFAYFGVNDLFYDRINGLFIDESVAGSFIIKLLIPALLILIINKSNTNYIFIFIFFAFISILLTGDRIPMFLFGLITIYFLLFNKNLKIVERLKIITSFLSIIVIIFLISQNFRSKITYTLEQLGMSKIEKIFYDIQYNVFDKSVTFSEYKQNSIQPDQNFSDTLWYQHYSKAIEIGKKNLIFGSGIKSFREACKNPEYNIYLNKELPNDYGCATHPHNIYIEIFSETGILGFIFLVLVVCNLIYRINSINRHLIKILLFSSIIVLFFPFQTTGSFFSTFNGVFYFINISIYLYFSSNQKYLKKSLKL